MKKLNNEALNVTSDQLSKDSSLKNYLKSPDGKKTDINIVDKNKVNSPTTTTLEEDNFVDVGPSLKKISRVIDKSTGKVSPEFIIDGVKYQMIRAIGPNKQIQLAVENCVDGEVYSVDEFDKNIATPAKNVIEQGLSEDDSVISQTNPNEEYIDFLNLNDLKGYKDFFVNVHTGEIVAKFKNAREMIKSGVKLGADEDYMDIKQLKRFRFRNLIKNDSEEVSEDVNLGKLQNDVKKLSKLIKDKFVIALEKINTPIEQSQFLVAMANEIGVPFAKLTSIINSFKDISKDQKNDFSNVNMNTNLSTNVVESVIITKNDLIESIKPISKKIKIKDIKNGKL